jgi:rare lipoprotein A
MGRQLVHGLATMLLLVSSGAGSGRAPIGSGLARTPSRSWKSSDPAPTGRTDARKSFQMGTASWYGARYDGKTTASGEPFDMYALTAAHPTLPFGTFVRVTNLSNGKTVTLRVNDRGPFVNGRIIDVSYHAARALNFVKTGVQLVRLDLPERPAGKVRIVPKHPPFGAVTR